MCVRFPLSSSCLCFFPPTHHAFLFGHHFPLLESWAEEGFHAEITDHPSRNISNVLHAISPANETAKKGKCGGQKQEGKEAKRRRKKTGKAALARLRVPITFHSPFNLTPTNDSKNNTCSLSPHLLSRPFDCCFVLSLALFVSVVAC